MQNNYKRGIKWNGSYVNVKTVTASMSELIAPVITIVTLCGAKESGKQSIGRVYK